MSSSRALCIKMHDPSGYFTCALLSMFIANEWAYNPHFVTGTVETYKLCGVCRLIL